MAALGRGGWPGRGLVRRALFRRVLAAARRGVRNRENLRFARTRIYGLLRELVNAVGARFAAAGILDDARDVYLLALDEVWDYVRGTAVSVDLRGLAEARRREWAAYREDAAAMPDDRFVTYGLPYHRNRFKARRRAGGAAAAAADGAALAGIPSSPGVVEGEVKVVRSPQDDLRLAGEILVAGRTDPGWVPLYPSVSGLLIERGSILSHSAIVAREMGIPTIVSIPGLLDRLASGDRVRMDGSAGTVEVLDEE
jgi:pyruvate,water dikinase